MPKVTKTKRMSDSVEPLDLVYQDPEAGDESIVFHALSEDGKLVAVVTVDPATSMLHADSDYPLPEWVGRQIAETLSAIINEGIKVVTQPGGLEAFKRCLREQHLRRLKAAH